MLLPRESTRLPTLTPEAVDDLRTAAQMSYRKLSSLVAGHGTEVPLDAARALLSLARGAIRACNEIDRLREIARLRAEPSRN